MKKLLFICIVAFFSQSIKAQEASDAKAIEIADKVMTAMGGKKLGLG